MDDVILSVSDFVALVNQTLEFAYPSVVVEGEVSGFRVSKGRWVYFDIKDEQSSVRCFGTTYQLQQPVEDGMMVRLRGFPRLHQRYGFSLNIQFITPSGEGSIKRAFELLKNQLQAEGLFDEARKRPLPRFPKTIGLITSSQAAAYHDFMRILNSRWGGVEVQLADVQVQGDAAPNQIVQAIQYFNEQPQPVDVLVLVRGGGSLEDLAAFSSEPVARAVAGSRTPTIVGVGHEVDISLADLVADVRAATPTNAAQLVVPDRAEVAQTLAHYEHVMLSDVQAQLGQYQQVIASAAHRLSRFFQLPAQRVGELRQVLTSLFDRQRQAHQQQFLQLRRTLSNVDPQRVLKRGYSIVRTTDQSIVRSRQQLKPGQAIMLELSDGNASAKVTNGN